MNQLMLPSIDEEVQYLNQWNLRAHQNVHSLKNSVEDLYGIRSMVHPAQLRSRQPRIHGKQKLQMEEWH